MRSLKEEIEYCQKNGFSFNSINLYTMLAWYGESVIAKNKEDSQPKTRYYHFCAKFVPDDIGTAQNRNDGVVKTSKSFSDPDTYHEIRNIIKDSVGFGEEGVLIIESLTLLEEK